MAYGSQQTLSDFLGELMAEVLATFEAGTTSPSTQTTIDSVITKARKDADALIDSMLGKQWTVPFADIGATPPTPAIIEKISDLLTASLLFKKRHPSSVEAQGWYEEALNLLNAIRNRELTVPGGTEVSGERAAVGLYTDPLAEPVFGGFDATTEDDRMNGW